MRILILGIGDAFTQRHFSTSAVIEGATGSFVLIDCPDLIHRVLKEASARSGWDIDATRIDDVILTHLHGDHCNGLESFGFYRRILRQRNARFVLPRLHASRAAAARLWERLAPAMETPIGENRPSTLNDYFDVRILEPGVAATVAGLSIECRRTRHSVPTIGLRVSDASGMLGWSSDTPFEHAHLDWLDTADIIVHESNLGPSHTPIENLNELPDSLRRKIRLIHLPDDFEMSRTDIAALREGEVIDVRMQR